MKRDKWKDKVELQRYLSALRNHVARFEQPDNRINAEKLRGAEQIFISMFDNAEDGILIADVEAKKVFVGNKSICQMLGYSQDEIENLSIMEFHPSDRLPYVIEQFEKQARRELTLARDIPLQRKDGSILYADINSFPIMLDHKKYLMGIFRDITGRRQTEKALKQSEEKFRLAMEATNDALWDWNLVTNEVYRNPRHATMLGYESHELSSSHEEWERLIHPDDKKILFDILNEHLEGKRDFYECEYRLKTKSGNYIWVLGRGKVVERDVDGSPIRMVGTNIDITLRKQAEQSLSESEKHYRMLAETMNDGLSQVDENGIKIYVNSRCAEILGYRPEEMIGRHWLDFYDEDAQKILQEQWARRKKGMAEPYEISNTRKDGRKIYIRISPRPIFDEDGTFRGSVAILTDITERKKALEEIGRLAKFPAENPNPVMRIDKNGTILYANPKSSELLEYWKCNIGQKLPEEQIWVVKEAIEKDKTLYNEVTCGSAVYELTYSPVKDSEFVNLYGLDITERKKMEEAHIKSEEKFRLAMEATNDALWDWNLKTNEVYRNPRHATMLGYKPDELSSSQQEWEKRIHPDDKPKVLKVLDENMGGKKDYFELEYRLQTKSGDYIWVLGRGKVVEYNDNGSPIRMIGTNIDITKQKQAEQNLRRREEQYRSVVEDSPFLLCSFLPNGEIVFVNTEYCEYFGKAREELIGTKFTYLIPEEHRQTVLDNILSLTEDSPTMTHEHLVTASDGRIRWQRWTNRALFDDQGRVVLLQSYGIDITESKKAEQALRQSEETLRSLINAITESVVLLDTKGTVVAINESCAERLGGSVSELMGKSAYGFLHPDIREYRKSKIEEVIRTGRPLQFEDRPPGRIVNSSCYPIYDTDGNVTRVAIFALDITVRKYMEQALAESEQKYRTLVESAGDAIATIDKDGEFLFMNTTAAESLGGKPEDFVGRTMVDIFPGDIAEKQLADVQEVIRTGKGLNLISLTQVQNQLRWYNTVIEPLKDSEGKTTAALMIARDIHEIKQAEEQIHRLSSAVEQSIDGIAMCDLEPRLLYVNDAYARMHGYALEEMAGMNLAVLHHDKSVMTCNEVVNRIKTQGAWVGELEHIRKDGSILPIYLSVTLLKDEKGEAIGSIGICRDMTEYKKAEQDLLIKDAAIASSITGIVIGDPNGNITYVNDSCLEMWGYKNSDEVVGRNVVEFCQNQDDALKIINTIRNEHSWIGELAAKKKDGSEFYVQVCATLITDSKGKTISMMGSFVDITEPRRNQEQLNAYREKMSRTEQLASLGTLSATVAHELTQPLTVIRLSLESALDKIQKKSPSDPCVKKIMDSLNQVTNIVTITQRFRNFARRSSGSISKEVDLKSVAERLAGLLAESSRRTNITLHVEDMKNLPYVYCNENEIEQMFFALINNAIQAADGREYRLLVISGIFKDKHIELKFADNCGGIAPENLNKIFEPFFTTKPVGKGTGLGLCIVQDIVYRAGGKIRVESEYGEGATFIVTLPVMDWSPGMRNY